MADELDDGAKLLRAKIVAAVGHERAYQRRIPRGEKTYPLVLFKFAPGGPGDTQGQGRQRLLARPRYDVMVVTKGAPTDESEAMVTAIDEELTGLTRAAQGDFSFSARRLNPIDYTSPGATAEEYFTYRGGTYQLWVGHNA